MKVGTKWLLRILGVAVLIFGLYQGYLHVHYRMYSGYTQYMDQERGLQYEEGRPFQAKSGGGNVPDMVLVDENAFLEMYTDVKSTNVAIYDKRTGHITYAIPPHVDEGPENTFNKNIIKSPIFIEYFNVRRKAGRFGAYDSAIQYEDQVKVESINGGIRYIYTLGDLTIKTDIVPLYLSHVRLEELAGQIENERNRNFFETSYEPLENDPNIMALREGSKGYANIQRLKGYLVEIGYTEENYLEDSLASGVEDAVKLSFEVPLEYRLDGDSVLISVPTAQIVENGGAKIDKIHFPRFFGAAGTDDDGYFFVPDGSGSLIHFNNGKTVSEDYNQPLYGRDQISFSDIVLGNQEMLRLPVFGIYKEGGPTIFGQIEEGHTFAGIFAAVSGRTTSYNNIFPYFIIRSNDTLLTYGITGNEGDLPVVESDLYVANLTVRYSFLDQDHEGYSGMARYYQKRLLREGVLGERQAQGDIPLYMDLIGAVTGSKFFLSVQYQGTIPMTTFNQASDIVSVFSDAGISNQVVNYQGWFNRGYFHDVPDKINLIGSLGSKKDLEKLSAQLEAQGGKLYADVLFQNIPWGSKRYNYTLENSRYYAASIPAFWADQISPDTYSYWSLGYHETWQGLLSPKFLPRYVDSFIKQIGKYDVTGISLRDLGETLHPDRKRSEVIDREHALSIITAQLDKLAGTGKDIMVSGGNQYSLRFADDLINVPLEHSNFLIIDEKVPFYQMVVHGYIPYAGLPFNRVDAVDEKTAVLQLLEYGASPHFTFTYDEASKMKYTGLNKFCGTHYENWTDLAIDLYQSVNPILSRVSGSVMTRHEITPDGLRCMTYDNGIQIIVNYFGSVLQYEGVTVPALSYALREGVAS